LKKSKIAVLKMLQPLHIETRDRKQKMIIFNQY